MYRNMQHSVILIKLMSSIIIQRKKCTAVRYGLFDYNAISSNVENKRINNSMQMVVHLFISYNPHW